MIHRILLSSLLALATSATVLAETVKDREGALRQDRAARENDPRWIYNDVDRGFAEARRTGKPLLVVLRCVPCLACAGIDTQVLTESSALAPLLDRFVCVRLINANTLDLSRFQFDFDLSFTTLIFNGDGTVYGRYGSWLHQKNSQETATAGYRATLQAALDLHAGYPANRESLAGKQGAPIAYKTPVEIPGLGGKYTPFLNWSGKVVPSCVHCHQVNDGLRLTLRNPSSTQTPNPRPSDSSSPMTPSPVCSRSPRVPSPPVPDSFLATTSNASPVNHSFPPPTSAGHSTASRSPPVFRRRSNATAARTPWTSRSRKVGDRRPTSPESQWIGSALTRLAPGRAVPATVLRGTNRLDLMLPIQ
jgi:hypothetical protein